MGMFEDPNSGTTDKSVVILQSLLCLLREKNVLSRADIEELCERVALRSGEATREPFPCGADAAAEAATEMAKIGGYIGSHYGGKHRRGPAALRS